MSANSKFVFFTGDETADIVNNVKLFIDLELNGKGRWIRYVDTDLDMSRKVTSAELGVRGPISEEKAFAIRSRVFAECAADTVWLLIPQGKDETNPYRDRESNWVKYEYNTLTRNPNVEKIIRVESDLETFEQRRMIWKKGDPLFGEPANTDIPLKTSNDHQNKITHR